MKDTDSGLLLTRPRMPDAGQPLWAAVPAAGLLSLLALLTEVPIVPALAAAGVCIGMAALLALLHKQALFPWLWLGAAALCFLTPAIDGLCGLWNRVSVLYTRRTAVLLPILQTEQSNLTPALLMLGWLAGLAGLWGARHRQAAAAILGLLSLGCCLIPGTVPVLPLLAAAVLLTAGGKAALRKLTALLLCLGLTGSMALLFPPDAAAVSRNTRHFLHHIRYETRDSSLPEGDFKHFDPERGKGTQALLVTMQKPEPMYLRGFTADTFRDGQWLPTAPAVLEENRQLLYWLYRQGFDPRSQYAAACAPLEVPTNTVTVEVLGACRYYGYAPYALASAPDPGASLRADWLPGGRQYSFRTVSAPESRLDSLVELLQQSQLPQVLAFRQAESAYRDFVRQTALQVPEDFVRELGPVLDGYRGNAPMTQARARDCTLQFLQDFFTPEQKDPRLPLPELPGSYYQYATAAALALRYYGIPARYAEGYVISPEMVEKPGQTVSVGASCGRAWVEIYQDGLGWMPMDLTPGFGALAGQQTQDGVQPTGGESGSLTEGQQLPDPEPLPPEPAPQGGSTVRLSQVLERALPLLPLCVLAVLLILLLRKLYWDRRRRRRLEDPAQLFAESAKLLSLMGLDRGSGPPEALCPLAEDRFGPEYSRQLQRMAALNDRSRFSLHPLTEPEQQEMAAFYRATLALTKKHIPRYRRVWLRWALCRY